MRRLLVFLLLIGGALGAAGLQSAFSAKGGGTCAVAPILRDSAVNQGVSGTAGYSPLVRGKDAIVRLYLSGPSCGTQTFQLTSASLQLKNGTANLGGPVAADPAPSNVNGSFPSIATYTAAAVANDTPGDAKFLLPGYLLTPCGGASPCANTGFTATFAATIGWRASDGTTGTSTFSITAPVDQKTNALRILVVKMGDLSGATYPAGKFPLFGADAQATVQNALSGTLARALPAPSGPAAGAPATGDLSSGAGGGIRYSFNLSALCAGQSPTCGMIDLHALLDAAGAPLLSPNRSFCLNGTNFAIVQPQLTNMLNAWNAANPGAIADRVLGVVDGSVSDQTCALGMAGFGTPEAVVRVDPGRNNNGATLVMEMAHTLGAVPAARSSISSKYHSPVTEADTGSSTADPNSGTNRAYNLSTRTYLSTDRTAMRVVDANWTDANIDFEAKDYALLRCAFGGSVPTDQTIGCGASGTTGSGAGVAADNVYVAGTLGSPTANIADVTESYVELGANFVPLTDGTANANSYFLVERAGATIVKKNELPVSCDTSFHDDGGGPANTTKCYFSGALPFDGSADQIEIWRGQPAGACTAPGNPAGCLYVRKKATAPPSTTVTGGGGGGVGVQTAWVHDTLHNGSTPDASTDNALMTVTRPDGAGNTYAGGYVTDCAGGGCSKDIAVQKLGPNGNVLWTSHEAGDGQPVAGDVADDIVRGIAFGPNGVYVTGVRAGTCNGSPRCPAGGEAMFVAGFNTDTGASQFLNLVDGAGDEVGNAIAYGDANNALYVAGGAQGTNTVNTGITSPTALAGRLWKVSPSDGTIITLRSSAAALSWTGVVTVANGATDDIWVTGSNVNAVVAHYADASGDLGLPDWISHFGSSVSNCAVTQDHSISGITTSTIHFDNQSGVDVRIFWLNYNGNLEQYPTGFANNVLPAGQSYDQSTWLTHPWIAVAPDGRCIGYTISDALTKTYTIQAPQAASETTAGIAHAGSTVFITGHTTGTIEAGQSGGAFVSRVDAGGDGMLWTRQFAGTGAGETGEGVAANNLGVYVVGSTSGSIGGVSNLGSSDAFLTHYDPSGNFLYATLFPTSAYDRGHGASVDTETGDIFAAGETMGQIGSDPGPGAGGRDGFVARFTEATQSGGAATVTSSWPAAADATNARLDVFYHCSDPNSDSSLNYPIALALQPTVNGSTAQFTVPNVPDHGCANGTMQFFENNGFSRFDVTPPSPLTLTASNTPPVAAIAEPKPNTHWLQYQTIPALGTGTDAQDGDFHGSKLHWSLTGPGGTTATTGDAPTFGGPPNGLAPGSYTLTLTVTDSGGLSGSASVHFTVDPDANNDWIPGTVSCISDTAANVAFGDADGDHIPNIDDPRPCTPDSLPDTTPPTITVTHVTDTSTSNSNATITFTVKASDAGSGLRSVFCTVDGNPAVGLKDASWASAAFSDTFTETASGAHAVICKATDLDYNTATATDSVYDFVGFLPPINNPPTVNVGNGGRTYPVKFKLISPTGASLGSAGLVKDIRFKPVACGSFSHDPSDAIEATATGGTSLRFEGSQWIYNWKTPSAKGCYVLYVLLSDGSTRQANFQLK